MINVAVCLIKKGDEFLFVKRSPEETVPNTWSLPAGTIEKGEKLFDTALREMREELGIDVKITRLINYHFFEETNVVLFFLLCSTDDSPRINQPEELTELKWLTFPKFFELYKDEEIAHGLRFLRKNPNIWEGL